MRAVESRERAARAAARPVVAAPPPTASSAQLDAAVDSFTSVPSTHAAAAALFAAHPTPRVICVGLAGLAAARMSSGDALGWGDAVGERRGWGRTRGQEVAARGPPPSSPPAAFLSAHAVWLWQEWAVHAHALHGSVEWAGRRVHDAHHARPYHHVSIDDPPLVLAAMAASAAVAVAFGALSGSWSGPVSALAGYWFGGLSYEAAHFAAHTRVRPVTRVGAALRSHHAKHHLAGGDRAWFAFQAPFLDRALGTDAPPPAGEGRVAAERGRAAAAAAAVARGGR